MTDQRPVTSWGTCDDCGKVCYGSRKHARRHARALNRAHLYAYQCPVDGRYWHLGHQPYLIARGVIARADFAPRSRS